MSIPSFEQPESLAAFHNLLKYRPETLGAVDDLSRWVNQEHEGSRALDVAVERLAAAYIEGQRGDSPVIDRHYAIAEKLITVIEEVGGELSHVETSRLSKETDSPKTLMALCATRQFGDKAKQLALLAAAQKGHEVSAKYLQGELNQNVTLDEGGNTPFMIAISAGAEDAVSALWEGAKRDVVNKKGENACDIAVANDGYRLAERLIEDGVVPAKHSTLLTLARAGEYEILNTLTTKESVQWNDSAAGATVPGILAKQMFDLHQQGKDKQALAALTAWRNVVGAGAQSGVCPEETFWKLIWSLTGDNFKTVLAAWSGFEVKDHLTQALLWKIQTGDTEDAIAIIELMGKNVNTIVNQKLDGFTGSNLLGWSPSLRPAGSQTALIYALSLGEKVKAGILRALLDCADVTLRGPGDKTTFEYALESGLYEAAAEIYTRHQLGFGGDAASARRRAAAYVVPSKIEALRELVKLGVVDRNLFLESMMKLGNEEERQSLAKLESELFAAKNT